MQKSPRIHEQYKSRRELALARIFIEQLGINSECLKAGNPSLGEPDVIYTDNQIGIEVSEVSYTQDDAEENNQLRKGVDKIAPGEVRNGKIPGLKEQMTKPGYSIDAMTISRTNEIIQKKITKKYKNISKIWLLIYLDLALFDVEDIALIEGNLCKDRGAFSRVYLMWKSNQSSGGGYSVHKLP